MKGQSKAPLIHNCLDKLHRAGKITSKAATQAKGLYDTLQAGMVPHTSTGTADAVAALQAAKQMAEWAMERKYSLALDALAQTRVTERLRSDPRGLRVGAVNLLRAMDAPGQVGAGGKTVESVTEIRRNQILKPFSQAIEAYASKMAGLKKDLNGPRNVIRELFGIDTGDQTAKAAATGWKESMQVAVDLAKQAGKVFSVAEDWRVPQFWSTARVREIGLDEFKRDMLTEIAQGHMRVVDEVHGGFAQGARIREILDASAQKIWMGSGEGTGGGTGSFNKELRVFRFVEGRNGGEAWLRLQGKYGVGQDIMQGLLGHIENQARELALMDVLGPSHRATWNMVREMAREETAANAMKPKEGFVARIGKLSLEDLSPAAGARKLAETFARAYGSDRMLDAMYRTQTGAADALHGTFWAGAFGGLKSIHVGANMGSAIISSVFPDTWTATMAARHNGMEAGRLVSRIVDEFAKGLGSGGSKETRELLSQMRLVSHSTVDSAVNAGRYAEETRVSEVMSKVASVVIRAQGQHAWDEALRRAFTMEFMGMAGRAASREYAALEAPFKAFLDKAKISAAEWDKLRGSALLEIDGARYLDPMSSPHTDLAERFTSAFLDERKFAVPQPGIMERAIVADMKRGTFMGELGRSFLMYKSFPLWMLTTHIQRAATLAAEGKGGYMAQAAIGLTLMGMLALQAKDLLNGKDPRDMSRWETWAAAAVQGGGAGIYGDFLNSAVTRADQGLVTSLLGPVPSTIESAARLTSGNMRQAVAGTPTHWQGEMVNFLRRHTPGSSLWYSRMVTDRLVWDQLQKMVDPEWSQSFQRVRDRAVKDWNQRFWWDRGATAPDRGPDMAAAWQRQ